MNVVTNSLYKEFGVDRQNPETIIRTTLPINKEKKQQCGVKFK